MVGWPLAIASAILFGAPAYAVFRWLGLAEWWQFALGGFIFATPIWYSFAEPFDSPRWQSAGFYDSLNYLGSGLVAGLLFWWFQRRSPSNNDAT
jgi:hypothetical protein